MGALAVAFHTSSAREGAAEGLSAKAHSAAVAAIAPSPRGVKVLRKRELRFRCVIGPRLLFGGKCQPGAHALVRLGPRIEIEDVVTHGRAVFAKDRAAGHPAHVFECAFGNPQIVRGLRGVQIGTSGAGRCRTFVGAVIRGVVAHRAFMRRDDSGFRLLRWRAEESAPRIAARRTAVSGKLRANSPLREKKLPRLRTGASSQITSPDSR